jgi:hypothetical protein
MTKNSIINGAVTAVIALAAIAMFLVAMGNHGAKVTERDKAKAALPLLEQRILEGSKSYWKIPAHPEFLTLELDAGQCTAFWERAGDDRKVDWHGNYEHRVLDYLVTARNIQTGRTRLLWGVLENGVPKPREFRAGDDMPLFDRFKEELDIRVSQRHGLPTYLHLEMLYVPESFGQKNGPLKNKMVP